MKVIRKPFTNYNQKLLGEQREGEILVSQFANDLVYNLIGREILKDEWALGSELIYCSDISVLYL